MTFRQRPGSTLIEALVGLALMAGVAMLATSGLGFGVRVDEASRRAEADLAMEATLTRLLSTSLRVAEPWRAPEGAPGFRGESARLEFVAPGTARRLEGTLNRYVFAIESDGDVDRILFERIPVLASGLDDAGDLSNGGGIERAQRAVLFEGAARWRFRYFGSDDDEEAVWRSTWHMPAERAPQLVMLQPAGEGAFGRDRAIVIPVASRLIEYCQAFRNDEACRRFRLTANGWESLP